MAHLIIHYDKENKCKQVVRPTIKFDGNWTKLAEHITKSDFMAGIRGYYRHEVVR